jgi:hypothetical protein
MNRRQALGVLLVACAPSTVAAAASSVSTLIGTGARGFSDREVNNPYGLVIGPDQALYFAISIINASDGSTSRPAR